MATPLHQIIGGTFEAVEGLYEEVRGSKNEGEAREMTAQDVSPQVKEGPATAEDLKNMQEQKKTMASKGEIWFNKQVVAELTQAQNEQASKGTIDMQRSRINTMLNLQDAYLGSVDAQGNVTRYHQAEVEKKEAETAGSQIQQAREQKKAQANPAEGSFEMGENELLKGGESKSHFTQSVG